jgi:hypothetical protein
LEERRRDGRVTAAERCNFHPNDRSSRAFTRGHRKHPFLRPKLPSTIHPNIPMVNHTQAVQPQRVGEAYVRLSIFYLEMQRRIRALHAAATFEVEITASHSLRSRMAGPGVPESCATKLRGCRQRLKFPRRGFRDISRRSNGSGSIFAFFFRKATKPRLQARICIAPIEA